jgi:transcriptional regulator with XRE-family HTH domain
VNKNLISHEDALRIARQDPEFIKEERRIKPFYELAKQIYLKRKKLNLNQKELAELSNTYQTRISKLEKADLNPQLSTIIAIAEALNCEVSIVLKDCEDIRVEAISNHDFFAVSENQESDFSRTESIIIQVKDRSEYAIPG